MKGNRVVVTGMGAVTPLGLDVPSSWEGICAGRSGATTITQFDASAFATRFSASVKDFSVEGYLEARDARRMDPVISKAWWPVFRHSEIPDWKLLGPILIVSAAPSDRGSWSWLHRRDSLARRAEGPQAHLTTVPGAIINMIMTTCLSCTTFRAQLSGRDSLYDGDSQHWLGCPPDCRRTWMPCWLAALRWQPSGRNRGSRLPGHCRPEMMTRHPHLAVGRGSRRFCAGRWCRHAHAGIA